MRITPVTKGVCGSIEIANLLTTFDIHSIGDAHIQNIAKMKQAGVKSRFMLLRAPMQSELEETVALADISLNSEMRTLKALNDCAGRIGRKHEVVLMVELGDRREGVLPEMALERVKDILELRSLKLAGIGANLTCLNGIKPTAEKMATLSALADEIEKTYSLKLDIVSGGNSANYQWLSVCSDAGRINHLRVGETILFGSDPITQEGIEGFEHDTFHLQAEVIESIRKPSKPNGEVTFDAFGQVPQVKDEGLMNRAILAIGTQDVDPSGCQPLDPGLRIIGTTSDHMVIDSGEKVLKVGDVVEFRLHYRALLRLMVSGYVPKIYF
jgi:predicted amino acid racemase